MSLYEDITEAMQLTSTDAGGGWGAHILPAVAILGLAASDTFSSALDDTSVRLLVEMNEASSQIPQLLLLCFFALVPLFSLLSGIDRSVDVLEVAPTSTTAVVPHPPYWYYRLLLLCISKR